MNKWKKWPVCLGMAMLCTVLPGCSGEEKDEGLPAEYSFSDEEKLPALGMVEEKEGTVCTVETDPETETESYVYTGLASGGEAAKEYVNQMMEEYDCAVVDEQGTKQQEPTFTEESGSVILGKNSQDETGMLQLKVEWSKDSCTVTPALVEGITVQDGAQNNLTVDEAVSQLESMTPQQLGLTGDSMAAYQVYAQEGYAMVDDIGCFCINVYTLDGVGSHQIEGTYLVRVDGMGIYRLNRQTNQVELLQ